ncbi:MAG: hypothetical protein ACRD0B_01485 [Acidimicrobiales bacterium]
MALNAIRPTPSDRIDLAAAQQAVADLETVLGQDLDGWQTRMTPRRVASPSAELLMALPFSLTSFRNDERCSASTSVRVRSVFHLTQIGRGRNHRSERRSP